MSVVGIDFGTHSCYIAVARAGGIETIANEYTDRSTPTYVSLNDKQRMVGASSKQQCVTNHKNTLTGFKAMIGRKFSDPAVQNELNRLHYTVVDGPGGRPGILVRYMDEDQVFTPEQITAMLLTKLKHTAEAALKTKVVDVVISVPCSFTDQQRRNMLLSCQIAGLNCLRLMNDTLAVSLAYGIYKQDLPTEDEKSRNVIFVDIGYTSLQATLCAFNKGKLKVLSVSTEPNLGGCDFDWMLLRHFAAEFQKKHKIDVLSNSKAKIRLLNEVEKVKKLMSANTQKIPLNVECLMNDIDVHTHIDRATFEGMISSYLERAEQALNALIRNIKFSPSDIHAVEVIGGSTRIPAIKNLVKSVYGIEPSTTLNADEAVARGCALQCAILSPTFRVRDFSITDCQLYPITLRWQGGMNEDSDLEICPKFHAVPFFKMLTFFRKDPLTIDCKYTYPNDIPYPNPKIASFCIDKIVPQTNGENSKIKVKVSMNIHGIFYISSASMIEKLPDADLTKDESMVIDKVNGELNATGSVELGKSDTEQSSSSEDQALNNPKEAANNENDTPMENEDANECPPSEEISDKKGGKKGTPTKKDDKKEDKKEEKKPKKTVKTIELPVQTLVDQLPRDEINNFIEKESQMVMQDKLEKERLNAKNAVEEYVYEMRDKLYSAYEPFILEKDRDKFSKVLDTMEDWIYNEGENLIKSEYVKKLDELKKFGDPVKKRYEEARDRPAAFEALGHALQQIRKFVDLANSKDEKYEHIAEDDVKKVEKCMKDKGDWFEKQMNAVNKLSPYADPPVLASQIYTELQSLEALCKPIINKPKPKVEPPKDDKGSGQQEPAANNAKQPQNASQNNTQPMDTGSQQSGDGSANMEVD